MKIIDQIHPSYDDLRPLLIEHSPDEYYKYILQFTGDQFRQRVDMVGFKDADHVLDAGCGYGQWSVALAEANRRVSACDRDPGCCGSPRLWSGAAELPTGSIFACMTSTRRCPMPMQASMPCGAEMS